MKPMSNVAINRLQKQLQEKCADLLTEWEAVHTNAFYPKLSTEESIEIAIGDPKFGIGLKRLFANCSYLHALELEKASPAVARAIRAIEQKNKQYFHMKAVFETFLAACVSDIMDTAVFAGDWVAVKSKLTYFDTLEDKIHESNLSCNWDQFLSELRGREHVEGLCE